MRARAWLPARPRSLRADDTPRYPAHSILYKTRLPFVLVFNKTDAQPHDFALEWMQDFEAFQRALNDPAGGSRDANGEPSYMNSLMGSMCLVLDEFYTHLRVGQSVASSSQSVG